MSNSNSWFAGNFCPRNANCSEGDDALSPSNGPKIRTLSFSDPVEPLSAEVRQFPDQESFFRAYTDPNSWIKCEGQLISIAENQAVFSLIGTKYGGDGRTNFGLPNLKKDGVVNDYYLCKDGEIPGFSGP